MRASTAPGSTLAAADFIAELATRAGRGEAAAPDRGLAAIVHDTVAVVIHPIPADFRGTGMDARVLVVAVVAG